LFACELGKRGGGSVLQHQLVVVALDQSHLHQQQLGDLKLAFQLAGGCHVGFAAGVKWFTMQLGTTALASLSD
jgi:hypothetical protein